MAIIRCPECNNEVSDIAATCPHCGYPLNLVEDAVSEPVHKSKKPLAVLSILLIAAVLFFGYKEISSFLWKQNYIDAFNTMVDGYNTTLAMTDDIHTVWYNAVFDLQDFDAALQRHFSSSTYKNKAKELNANVSIASEYMVKLSKVPSGYERQYKAIENYYDYYYDFAQCALNPSGSLLSYTQDINNLSDSAHRYYSECYNYIEAW